MGKIRMGAICELDTQSQKDSIDIEALNNERILAPSWQCVGW